MDERPECGHEAVAAYEVTFTVGDVEACELDAAEAEATDGTEATEDAAPEKADEDAISSACDMVAAVVETDPADADAVGCGVESCEYYHERVAERLRVDAERHSGNVVRL